MATRHPPALRACYARLCTEGKPKQGARSTCMRKLLPLRDAMRHHRTPWQPHLTAPGA